MTERGATKDEVIATIAQGERFPAKYGRSAFRRNFGFDGVRHGRHYGTKQLEVFAVREGSRWVVVTVIVRFF